MENIYAVEGYTLHQCIGEGVYSLVFLAECNLTAERYAIKVVHKGKRRQRGTMHAEKEISALLPLQGIPGVVKMHKHLEDDSAVYIVLSLHQGPTLSTRSLFQSTQSLLDAAYSILGTLEQIHRHGVFHLDIKPANLILSACMPPVLIDFGCSMLCPSGYIEESLLPFEGTPAYMAPEMVKRSSHGAKKLVSLEALDVWSFGCLLYFIACGKEAFSAPSLYSLYPKIVECDVDYAPLPREVESICRQIFVSAPARRSSLSFLLAHFSSLTSPGPRSPRS
ncbi:hypothetical protein NEDG_00145 [Nematocida displodere]|uniref:Protein kinase domain-containing protein n=1 Tax=Nematocida displodere TaxID=1805483 RepID=A0A177EJW7_9MICR|nr:hypothetical protein NEDG_00145 [Nematocida displodere]